MKKILLSLALLVIFSGCGSDESSGKGQKQKEITSLEEANTFYEDIKSITTKSTFETKAEYETRVGEELDKIGIVKAKKYYTILNRSYDVESQIMAVEIPSTFKMGIDLAGTDSMSIIRSSGISWSEQTITFDVKATEAEEIINAFYLQIEFSLDKDTTSTDIEYHTGFFEYEEKIVYGANMVSVDLCNVYRSKCIEIY